MTDQPDPDQVQRDRATVRRLLDELEAATDFTPGRAPDIRRVRKAIRQLRELAARAPWAVEALAP